VESLDEVLEKALEALKRDVSNIFAKSHNKLGPAEARDLVAYLKFLAERSEERTKAAKTLDKLPEDELRKLAEELLKK
jgi:uncharacterized protein with von Willebrand factor type A (vWA) domain